MEYKPSRCRNGCTRVAECLLDFFESDDTATALVPALIAQRDCFTENVWPAIVAEPFRLRGLPV